MNPINSYAHDGVTANTTPSNPINDPGVSNRQGLNTFDLTAQNALTARYGEITPFFYSVGVPDDRTTLQPSHMLRTYTFGSPLLSTMRMHVQNFSVPLSAIMPNTWDLIYKNPVRGADVPDDALCGVNLYTLQTNLAKCLYNLQASISALDTIDKKFAAALKALPYMMLYYNAFSVGGLFHYLGISANFEDDALSIDKRFDLQFGNLMGVLSKMDADTKLMEFWLSTDAYYVTLYPTLSSFRMFFNYALDNPETFVDSISVMSSTQGVFKSAFVTFVIALCNIQESTHFSISSRNHPTRKVNLYKVAAYQMICSQYFTNDHVDDIYTSKLFLQNMRSLVLQAFGTAVRYTDIRFVYNGVSIEYDVFSNKFLEFMSVKIGNGDTGNFGLYFWNNLLTFRRSLKYGDYFNSARTQPLAVGDVTAPVVGNKVSAIDTTKSISYQRFLNAVNRAGSYIKDYVKSIFGVTPEQIEPMPNFLSRETYVLGKDEIDNNADAQGNVVTNMIDTDSRFAFDIYLDTPSVILGLLTFDCVGCYQYVTEKDNFHINRFDMFNPFLQNIGDQSVSCYELDPLREDAATYGYQVRNAEYKFKVNQCHGGFVYNLPSWLFTFDDKGVYFINSETIRSKPADLDKFYKSLSYASAAGYFHFIISMTNEVKSNRRMQFEPNIL